MNNHRQLRIHHAGRQHLVTLKPMLKGTIVEVHTPDGGASAATSVRPPEPPEAAARWLLDHHRIFKGQKPAEE